MVPCRQAISAAKRLLSVVSETTWKDVPSDASEWTRPTRPNGLVRPSGGSEEGGFQRVFPPGRNLRR